MGGPWCRCTASVELDESGGRGEGVVTENSVRSENTEVPIIREIMVPATMMLAEEKKLSLDDSITGRLSEGEGADGRDEAA
jgi:hypothetical protein